MLLFALAAILPIATRVRGCGNYAQLPLSGSNYTAYSTSLYALGRCYLLTPVTSAVEDAYAQLETACPDQHFIYAEMGWKGGGRFDPHRTHREGTSADFITPMRNKDSGMPENLPIGVSNRWGYDLRLNANGEYENLRMDAEAVILHLKALDDAARKYGWRVRRVIFDPPMMKILKNHKDFERISNITFMAGQAWFPHDGHYHVDFEKLPN